MPPFTTFSQRVVRPGYTKLNSQFIKLKRTYASASPSVYETIRSHPNTGLKYAGLAGSIALGGMISYNLSRPATFVPYEHRAFMDAAGGTSFAKIVRGRIMKTYGYLTASLGVTAVTAGLLWNRGFAMRIFALNPFVFAIGSLVATMGCISMTMALDYNRSPGAKHLFWMGTNAILGVSLCTMGMFGGAIIQQAAMITGMIVGSMSLVAMSAPNDTFLKMGPYLGVGLGVVVAASLGGMLFPGSSLLMNVSLYGGLGLFGLYTAHDAQRVLEQAQTAEFYDPITMQMGLYMDTINIFVRIVQILAMSQRRK